MSKLEQCVKIPFSRYEELMRKEAIADAVIFELEQEALEPKVVVDVLKCVTYINKKKKEVN